MIIHTASTESSADGSAPRSAPLASPGGFSVTLISPGLPATPSPRGGGPRPPPVAVVTSPRGYYGGSSASGSSTTLDRSPRWGDRSPAHARPSLPASPASSTSLSPRAAAAAAACASCACHLDLADDAAAAPPAPPTSDAATLAALTQNADERRQPHPLPLQPQAVPALLPTPPPTRDDKTPGAGPDHNATWWWGRPRAPTPPPEPELAPAPATALVAGRRRAHSGPTAVSTAGAMGERDGKGDSGGGGVLARRGVLRQLRARLRGKSNAGLSSATPRPTGSGGPPDVAPRRPAVSLFPAPGAQSTSAYQSGGRPLPVVTVRASVAARRREDHQYVVVEHWTE
jgi:hypothetical protein